MSGKTVVAVKVLKDDLAKALRENKIQVLKLNLNGDADSCGQLADAKAVASAIQKCTSLKELLVKGWPEKWADHLSTILKNKSITHLRVQDCITEKMSVMAIEDTLKSNNSIIYLTIAHTTFASTTLDYLCDALSKNRTIQGITFESVQITSGTAGKLENICQIPSLQHLRFSGTKLGDESTKRIATAVKNCNHINRFSLHKAKLDHIDEVVEQLAGCSALTTLDLSENFRGISVEQLAEILYNATKCKKLRKLVLRGSGYSWDAGTVTDILEGLSKVKSLEEIGRAHV